MSINSFMKDGIPTINPAEVLKLEDVEFIDVRMPDEYTGELGHVAGTKLITLGLELDKFLKSAKKDAAIVFICRSGARSGKATAAAVELGFKEVYNMEGGMLAWNKMSLPVVR
jgi:rhodanese-related sulfurtransferase